MREIKFRAWSPELNRMVTPKDVTDPYHVECLPTDRGFELYSPKELKNIPMQYTGLKDKNGVEIYEGDILQHVDGTTDNAFLHEIIWHDYGFFMREGWKRDKPEHYVNMPCSSTHIKNWSVIGNIYENAELIK